MAYEDTTGGLGGLGGYLNNLNMGDLGKASALMTAGQPSTKPQNMMQTLSPLLAADQKNDALKAKLKAAGYTDEQIAAALAKQGGLQIAAALQPTPPGYGQ